MGDHKRVDQIFVQQAQKLIQSARTHNIVPTLGGKPVLPESARLITGANDVWLPAALFPEVVPIRNADEYRFLVSLGVPPLDVKEIRNRILTGRGLTSDERVVLISGMLEQGNLHEAYTSALFLDSAGRGLGDGMRVFLAPSSTDIPELPEWVDLRFLNENMRTKLAQKLKARDNRDLQQKLSGFGLQEYSLANVIRALVAECNRAEKGNPDNREAYQTDLLRTVFDLYNAEEPGSKRPEYPERSPLQLFNQKGSMASANILYLGRGFGPHGEIVQGLYGAWAPEKVINLERIMALTGEIEKLKEFLLWIGVAEWPRDIKEQNADSAFVRHALQAITYPAKFEEQIVTSANKAPSAFVSDVHGIDGLDEILRKAEPATIALWLANDDRALAWGRYSPEHVTLRAYPHGVRIARGYSGSLPSYIRWRMETTAWLRSDDGILLRPKDCVLGERAVEELFPRPVMPDQTTLEQYGAQQRDVLEGWRRTGVLTSLAYLERDEIYAKLLELPQRNPDGKLARPLYHWLIDASDIALGGDGPNQAEFLMQGKMWGRYGNDVGYYPIRELHHADIEGLPDELLQRLKIVDLRKRVGAEKVERLFGVKAVDRAGIKQRIVSKDIAVGSSRANGDFQACKPFLHKLRASQTSQLTQLHALRDLQLEVCSTLRAEIIFEGVFYEYAVPVWGWLIEDSILHVRSDPAKPMLLSDSLLSDAIGEALASIFRIADGGEYARMLICKEEDRPLLLRRLRGESVLEDFDSIRAEYALFEASRTIEARFPVAEPPVIIPPSAEAADISTPVSSQVLAPTSTAAAEQIDPLKIVEEVHEPVVPAEPRKLQVKTVTTAGSRAGGYTRVTNGDFCERKAMEFEEACEPPRWPLPVGQITGLDGPGCDVLSFASQADREAFRKGPIRDLKTVFRFIEVKGRGSTGAIIELKGNELSTAERSGERYFLYRLFEAADGTFELSILQNPLIHKESLQPAVHVAMERSEATKRFSLIGGLQEDKE